MLNLNPKWLALGGFLFLGTGLFVWLCLSRAHLQAKLAQISADQALCLQANADWQDKANQFDVQMRQLKAETDARAFLAAKALQKAEEDSQRHIKMAARLMNNARPSQQTDCVAALALLHSYTRGHLKNEPEHDD